MKAKDCPNCEAANLDKILACRKELIEHIRKNNLPKLGTYLETAGLHVSNEYIKSKCFECVGYVDVSDSVQDCRGFSCPLYFARPFQFEDTEEIRKKTFEIEGNY